MATDVERRGISARAWVLALVGLVVLGVAIHFSVTGLFDHLKEHFAALDPQPAPVLAGRPKPLPPEPRLQPDPVGDLNKMRRAEDQVLTSYGWVDKNAGVVRIPVEQALKLAAARGLPAPPAPPRPQRMPAPQPPPPEQK